MAVDEISCGDAAACARSCMDCRLSCARRACLLDRRQRDADGRDGISCDSSDPVHLWNDHRSEHASKFAYGQTDAADEGYCERRTRRNYRNGPRASLPCALAGSHRGASLRPSNLRYGNLVSVGAFGRYISLPDLFRRILQILATDEVGIDHGEI